MALQGTAQISFDLSLNARSIDNTSAAFHTFQTGTGSFVSVPVAHGTDFVFTKSATIGVTFYRATDPLVFSLTTGFRPVFARTVQGRRVDPADTFFINSRVAFAANNEVTITGGVLLRLEGGEKNRRGGTPPEKNTRIHSPGHRLGMGQTYNVSCRRTYQCCRHASLLFFDHPDNLCLGKSALSHSFAPSKG